MLEFITENIWTILLVLNYLLAITAAIIILFKNINPIKTLSYIIILVFLPFFGLVVYYFFGQEYRKNKIFNRKHILNKKVVKEINKELELNQTEKNQIKEVLEDKVKLVKLLYNNDESPLTLQNEVTLLKNGDEKFKHLLKDLENAKHHIHLEYYIFTDDEIGTQVIDILCKKALEGVKVKLTVDDVGSKFSFKTKKKLKQSGVEFYFFMPVLFPSFTGKMNYRNHRKIAIIDGLIGYLGGINISDNYLNNNDTKRFWRDTHIRIVGEAIKPLQIHFFMTWNFVSKDSLVISKEYFPDNNIKSSLPIQIAASGPDTDWANIMEVLLVAIITASKYVYITTPYFIPNDEFILAMQVAAKSGVEVKLMIPYKSDSWSAKYATNSYLQPLLESGVQIYRYKKGFIHSKTVVVDDIFSTIGTSNMDYRSFEINFEINALLYSEEVSKELKNHFNEDLKNCKELNLSQWEKRPKIQKFQESVCRLIAPLL